mmetsp:Transcript_24092/g.60334  ORF Transcript_24092/g.60334 Transcript_24092/m.60334 type:complete len:241 (+) Transcript_24092:199-921(+)
MWNSFGTTSLQNWEYGCAQAGGWIPATLILAPPVVILVLVLAVAASAPARGPACTGVLAAVTAVDRDAVAAPAAVAAGVALAARGDAQSRAWNSHGAGQRGQRGRTQGARDWRRAFRHHRVNLPHALDLLEKTQTLTDGGYAVVAQLVAIQCQHLPTVQLLCVDQPAQRAVVLDAGPEVRFELSPLAGLLGVQKVGAVQSSARLVTGLFPQLLRPPLHQLHESLEALQCALSLADLERVG